MNPELELIASCIRDREAFDTANDLLSREDWTPISNRVFKAIQEFYRKDETVDHADWRYVYEYASRGMSSDAQKDQVRELLEQAKGLEVSTKNVLAHALEVRRQSLGLKLAESLCNGEHDEETFELYTKIIETEDLSQMMGDELVGVGIDELMEVLDEKNKIPMFPKSLNDRIGGGLVAGDNVILGARPEGGKTAMVVTNMAGMASRGHKVLYCGNEDAIKKVIVRVVSCLTGKKALEMMQDPKATMELARKRGYDNIVFAHPVSTAGHVANLCRRHKPKVVMVDQVRNLKVSADNRTGQLEAAGIAMRNIAAEQRVAAIGVTQVGDSGEQKLRLGMSDIDSSKTGIPACCDIMILIGVDNAFDAANSRMLNLPKNKTGGGHDAWQVKLDPTISRYYDE